MLMDSNLVAWPSYVDMPCLRWYVTYIHLGFYTFGGTQAYSD